MYGNSVFWENKNDETQNSLKMLYWACWTLFGGVNVVSCHGLCNSRFKRKMIDWMKRFM